MKQSGIYKLEWKDSGYYYYGQSVNLKERKVQHFTKIRKQKHCNKVIQRISDKYGLPEFIIIELCEYDKLDEIEQGYINFHISNKKCCNLSPTASSNRGYKWSEESKKKISEIAKNRVVSDETKEKARIQMNKRYASGYKVIGLKGVDNGFYKKKHDLATRLIMSQKKEGKYLGGNNPKAKLVLNVETGIFYETVKLATDSQVKYKEGTIYKYLNNYKKNKTSFIAA
jgi:group I intron endonuclease